MRWIDWLRDHQFLAGWMFALSVLLFLGSLIVIPLIVSRMRADYFIHRQPPPSSWTGRHRALRLAWLLGKNLLGAILVLAGLAMLVLPGQGVITILVGLTMLNFPGKRELELWIVRRRGVRRAIAWIRQRAGSKPLVLPAPAEPGE